MIFLWAGCLENDLDAYMTSELSYFSALELKYR